MKPLLRRFVPVLAVLCHVSFAQAPAPSAIPTATPTACTISPATPNHDLPNIFSPEQEVQLGEVLTKIVNSHASELDEPALTAYLQKLGDGLVRHLPPTGLRFRFYLSSLPVANAFSIAGGRVYVTKKLIGYAHSEDELVGVLAHELGHIVTHQSAIDYTRFFKAIGVTEVKDGADIEAKFHQLLESGKRFEVREEDRQMEADRVGLELTALAGYKADALADFYDRITNNQGKTGSWFTDIFGVTAKSSKRLREMNKTLRQFPAGCSQTVATGAPEFRAWQSKVVAYSGTGRIESVPGLLAKKELEPPLQDEVHTLRFSYDGKYLLAQDDGSIYVLTRDPLVIQFRIEAPEAYPANFSWDSKRVTFYNPDLHVEEWDLDAGTPVNVYEVVSSSGCMQSALSPDGKTLACVDSKETLVLLDTATGDRLFERKDVRHGDYALNMGLGSLRVQYDIRFLNMGFSLDSRYFVVSGGDASLAVDVPAREEIALNGAVKTFLQGGFNFIADRTVVGSDKAGSRAAILSFPEGVIQQKIDLGAAAPFRVAKGDYVLLRPIQDFAVGVLDTHTNTIVRASKTPALDVYGEISAAMLPSGEVGIFGTAPAPLAKINLPRGHFGTLRGAAISEDLNWLAASTRSRGSVWNLSAGTRPYNLLGFRGGCFPKDGNLYVDFPKRGKVDRAIIRAGLQQTGLTLAENVGRGRAWQDCQYVVNLKAKSDEAGVPKDKTKDKDKDDDDDDEDKRDYRFEGNRILSRQVFGPADIDKILEVRDVVTGTLLWSKGFKKVTPAIYSDAPGNIMAFRWRLSAEGARAELKGLPNVLQMAGSGRDDDYLVEVVELSSGKFINAIILDTANGAFTITRHMATKEWIIAYDSLGRTLVYSLKSGKCTGKFFGRARNLSPAGTLIIENAPGRETVYDPESKNTRDMVFAFPVSDTFFTQDGKRLALLTNDQVLYTIDPFVPK
jgi:Peptidase family M48